MAFHPIIQTGSKQLLYFFIKSMTVQKFQKLIEQIYFDQDAARGVDGTFVWFAEEVGELAKEIRRVPRQADRLREEFADVFAWLSTLANLLGIDLQEAAEIYASGCPKCQSIPCACQRSTGDSERNAASP